MSTPPEDVAHRLAGVRAALADACRAAGRPAGSVRLVAASKGQPAAAIRAAAAAGQRLFGENYAREMRDKRTELAGYTKDLEWHFIGRVQSGNAKEIAGAALVHGVGSRSQLEALARHGPVAALLQVSLWGEASKNGFMEAELERDLEGLLEVDGAAVRGFMAMPPPGVAAREAFAAVRALRDRLAPQLPELSMGMSGDYREAALEGATLVRVGTAIFGPRPAKKESA